MVTMMFFFFSFFCHRKWTPHIHQLISPESNLFSLRTQVSFIFQCFKQQHYHSRLVRMLVCSSEPREQTQTNGSLSCETASRHTNTKQTVAQSFQLKKKISDKKKEQKTHSSKEFTYPHKPAPSSLKGRHQPIREPHLSQKALCLCHRHMATLP